MYGDFGGEKMAAQSERSKQILALAIAASDKLLMDIYIESDSDNDEQIQVELRNRINNIFGPETYELLEQRLSNFLSKENDDRSMIPVRKQLLASLWLLATPDSYRSVGERFEFAKSSLSISFMRVVKALNNIADSVIEWPRGEKATHMKQAFQHFAGLPNVPGAIDWTYI